MTADLTGDSSLQEPLSRRSRLQEELRILAVDDDHSILQLLKTALSAFNFDISISDSGANALKQIARQDKPFDCFLLDIQMPAMNGIMLCKEIRRMPEYRQAPILMLTAMSDREYVDLAFVAGATDYVTKPFDFLELRSRMSAAQRLVQERRIADATAASRAQTEQDSKVDFEEAFSVKEYDRVLRYSEFDNYIMQLSQGRLFNTRATAIKLFDAEQLYSSVTGEEFEKIIGDAAYAISNATKKTGDIISYRGSGVFVVVRHGRFSTSPSEIEGAITQVLLNRLAQRQSKARPQIIVGESVSLRSLSKSGSLMSVSRAIENAETRDQLLREELSVPKRAFSTPVAAGDQDHNRVRAYQSVLRDLFRDEPSLRSE